MTADAPLPVFPCDHRCCPAATHPTAAHHGVDPDECTSCLSMKLVGEPEAVVRVHCGHACCIAPTDRTHKHDFPADRCPGCRAVARRTDEDVRQAARRTAHLWVAERIVNCLEDMPVADPLVCRSIEDLAAEHRSLGNARP